MEKYLPTIFDYVDFREYLEDYRAARRARDPGFTHLYICQKLGQAKSRGLYNNIIRGRKELTLTVVDRLVDLLELKEEEEASYFRALVSYAQATDARRKERCFDTLVRLNRTPKKLVGREIDGIPVRTMTVTASVSRRGYERIVEKLEQARAEIRSIIHRDEDAAERVCLVTMQVFPQSKARKKRIK